MIGHGISGPVQCGCDGVRDRRPSQKCVLKQPEAGFIHHINGAFGTDMMFPLHQPFGAGLLESAPICRPVRCSAIILA
jgi:hypothetical protein